MKQAHGTDLREGSGRVSPREIFHLAAKLVRSKLAKPAGMLIVAVLLAGAWPSYAQRGGGSGGGHFGGGGGSHSSGGGGGSHASGAGRVSGAGSHSSGSGSSTSAGKGNSLGHRSGFGAALRHFFGLSSASRAQTPEPTRVASGVNPSNSLLGKRASAADLPPALEKVHLARTPSAFEETRLSVGPAISAPPRPIRPHPRGSYPYYPVGYGCYACDFGFGFGFGLPLFDFAYWDWGWSTPFWHHSAQSAPVMLLYLQDDSALEVTDYWVDGDTLYYVTVDKTKGAVSVAELDLQRTTDANARVGLKFTLDRTQPGGPFEKLPGPSDPANQVQPQQE